MTKRRNVIVHIATSADGYVARSDGDLEWRTSRPAPESCSFITACEPAGVTTCGDPHMATQNCRPLWACPRCKRRFANRNQSHSCGRHDLAHHFRGKDRTIRLLFDTVRRAIAACGPVIVLPEKTRIAFQGRMSFAQVTPHQHWLDGHVVLARRLPHPRFRRIETFSPRNHVHHFRLVSPAEVDAEFSSWLREAYAVGAQEHLKPRRGA